MLTKASSTLNRPGRPATHEERQAMARLSFALNHVLRLYRMATVTLGQPTAELSAIEESLGRAQLPDELVEVARAVALLKAPPPREGGTGLSGAVHARFAMMLRDMSRALAMPQIEEEVCALASSGSSGSVDPEPLLAIARRIVQSLVVQKSTTEILEDCLENVGDGIQRMANEEAGIGVRLASMRERLVSHGPDADVVVARRALIEETAAFERLVLERRRALEDLQRQSRMAQRRAERLLSALADATTAACTDPLTGLGNRRALADAVVRLASSPVQIGVLAIDLDHFKRVNDTHGHAAGDRVLVHVSELLRAELRPDDLGFRVGGEELLVLLARCDANGAVATADRIRERLASRPVPLGATRLSVTMSVGVALWKPGTSFEATQDAADEALYEAKKTGRNRAILAP